MAPLAVPPTRPDQTIPVKATKTDPDVGNVEANSTDVKVALDAAIERYTQRNPRSQQLHIEAVESLPGGNTRSLLHSSPFPLSMKSGKGSTVTDEDGHMYTDFVGELTAGLYGHSNPIIRETIINTIDTVGLNLGATIGQEAAHARLMCERFSLGRVRFTNSGTEANLHALAATRRFTGKRKVVVFDGGYHGAVLCWGSGESEPNNVDLGDWIIAKYNDVESARSAILGSKDIAAVMVEGMQGAGGCLPATTEFLRAIQDAAKEAGVLFLLDEVMTSRLAPSGIAELHSLTPDLKSFGKYLGGGLAFGAFGGREDVMSVYDPRGTNPLAHSGTFNNNTLAMHAGFAGLSKIYTPEIATTFNARGEALLAQLTELTKGTKCSFTGRGTIMAVHFSDNGARPTRREDIVERWDLKDLFFMEMLEDRYWITRRGSMAIILETPEEEFQRFATCVEKFLERHKELMKTTA